jgi:hypothetical protein
MVFGLLAACGQQPAPATSERVVKTPKADIDEVEALIAATKQHPSLVNGAKDAGPPIHVDPIPRKDDMVHHQHMMK